MSKGIQNIFQKLMHQKNKTRKSVFIISKIKKNDNKFLNLNRKIEPNRNKNLNNSGKTTNGFISKNEKYREMEIDSDKKDPLQNSIINHKNGINNFKFANDSFYTTDNSYGDNYSTANSNIENEMKKLNISLQTNKDYLEEIKKTEINNSIETFNENEIKDISDSLVEKEDEYVDEILENLIFEEENNKFKINPDYFTFQVEINNKMRIILIDWLLGICNKLKFKEETFFTTIYIIDAYLSKKFIKRKNFQLLGVTALFISTKINEIFFGRVKDYAFATDNAYEEKDILKMEIDIARTLNFNFLVPTCLSFFQIYSKKIGFNDDSEASKFGKFLIQNFLMSSKCFKYNYSIISITSCFLIMKLFGNVIFLNNDLFDKDKLSIIEECAKTICNVIVEILELKMNLTVKKYYYGNFCTDIKKIISLYSN